MDYFEWLSFARGNFLPVTEARYVFPAAKKSTHGIILFRQMANQSQSLFRLIHSLSQSEKRYFTISAAGQRDSTAYLKLFKAIDLQEKYDERELKDQFSNEPFISYFSVIKVQLYHFLLKSLRNFHESRSVDFTLKEVMMDAAILNEKALYSESGAMLQRARALALQHEDWKVLLEILHKEYTLIAMTAEPRDLEKELNRINADEKNFIAQLNNYGELAYLALSLTMLLKKHRGVKDLSKVAAIAKVMQHPLLRNEKQALSFRAQSLYYYIWSAYLVATRQFEKSEYYLTAQIELYNRHRHFLQAAPGNYLGALSDLLVSRFRTRQYDEVLRLIGQLKKLPDSNEIKRVTSKRFRMVIFSWTFKVEVGVAIQTGTVRAQLHPIQEQEVFFHRYSAVMEPRRRLETMLALAAFYFHLPDHKRSAQLIEKLLSDDASALNHEINAVARVLQIVIHYDDGSFDVLDYLVSGLKRFVAKQKDATKMEKQLVEFANKLEHLHRKKNQPDFFALQLKKFSELKKDRFEKHNFDYFDITEWLKKKMERQ